MRPPTKTQLAQIGDVSRRRGIAIPPHLEPQTREDGDRLVRALLYIDGETGPRGRMPGVEMEVDLDLVHQLEASREEKRMADETKTCNECGETKPSTEFYKGNAKCKPCYNARQRKLKAKRAKRKAERRAESASKPEPEPSFTPAEEDLDVPEKAAGEHWCISELRDPRLSTIHQAQKVIESVLDVEVSVDATALVLAQIAGLDLA